MYEASEIFDDVYNRGVAEGLIEDAEVLHILSAEGKYTEENEKELYEVLPKHIEYWQKELYNSYFRSNDQKVIRKYLAKAREEQLRLYSIRHSLDQYTAVETANFIRYQFIIENTTFFEGKPVDWDKISINSVIDLYNKNAISPEKIREISHTMPWANQWSVCKANGRVFDQAGISLSISQQLLLLWSKMYDNIHESPECPPDDVLDDDDMLDGWLALQKEKRMGERKNDFTINNQKIAGCENIYVAAQNVEDAQKVDNLNSPYSRAIKKSRLNYINKVGKTDYINLPDVKMSAQMQAREKYAKNG